MSDLRPWTVLSSETVLDYRPWLRVIRQSVLLPNGVHIPDYLLTPARDYAMVVAVTDTSEVVLVRQYKHGLGRAVLDFPAGYLDSPAEDPLACAQRELREETGYESMDWLALGKWCLDSNRSDTSAHFFLARHIQAVARPKLDDTEALEHFRLPLHDLPALFRSGDLPTMAGPAIWGLAAPHLVG